MQTDSFLPGAKLDSLICWARSLGPLWSITDHQALASKQAFSIMKLPKDKPKRNPKCLFCWTNPVLYPHTLFLMQEGPWAMFRLVETFLRKTGRQLASDKGHKT